MSLGAFQLWGRGIAPLRSALDSTSFVCAGFREVLCFWRYPAGSMSPWVTGARRGPTRYDGEGERRGLARTQLSTGTRRTSKTEQICLASIASNSRRSRRSIPVLGEIQEL